MGAELAVVSSQRMMMLHLHSQTFHTARRVTQPDVSHSQECQSCPHQWVPCMTVYLYVRPITA